MTADAENPIDSSSQPQSAPRLLSPLSPNLDAVAGTPLTSDLALAVIKNRDLSCEVVEQISRNSAVMKSRKVRLALAAHPRAPRRIALRVIRELYTFDLLQFSLLPAVAADLKRVAEELLVGRLASVTLGERISLARRCSARVAAALLLDRESRVWQTALENPRLREAGIVKALLRLSVLPALVKALCHHSKWSGRDEIRTALLRSEYTSLACALEFAHRLPAVKLRDVLHGSRLPEKIKTYLRKDLETRGQSRAGIEAESQNLKSKI
jgi:hypothetical protein